MPITVKTPIISFFGLQTPFRCGLFGSSRTGKTSFIYQLLKNNLFDREFSVVYYCYPSLYNNELDWHESLDMNVEYLDHIPSREELLLMEDNSAIILDDCWYSCSLDANVRDLFKVLSGKKNISIFITSQNPFEGGSNARTIRNNLNYYILFKNLGDHQINRKLSQQLGMLAKYDSAATVLQKRYESVFINLDVTLKNEELRVCTNILDTPICYV